MRSRRAIAVACVLAIALGALALRGSCSETHEQAARAGRAVPAALQAAGAELDAPSAEAQRSQAPVQLEMAASQQAGLLETARPVPPTFDQIARWIEDLRDDEVAGNATSAMYALGRNLRLASDALAAVVNSDDEQQRKLALYLLASSPRSLDLPRAAELYIAELAPDDLPHPRTPPSEQRSEALPVHAAHNASRAAEWLHQHADLARPALEAAWLRRTGASSDVQAELTVAALLALDDVSRFRWAAREALIERMRDNDVPRDAALAFDVLSSVGIEALPLVDRAWPTADEQQRGHLARWLDENAPSDPRGADRESHQPSGIARSGGIESLLYRFLWAQ
jgi:hypothetical protein